MKLSELLFYLCIIVEGVKMLSKLIKLIINFSKSYSINKKFIYKIEEINTQLDRVVLSCRGKGATIVTTIHDISQDEYIINGLPPHHACWIGYYYGKNWLITRELVNCEKSSFSLYPKHFDSNYKIICQNRTGDIVYQNIKSGIVYNLEPMALAKSKIIAKFNSSQAFYVGFLAAIKRIKSVPPITGIISKYPSYLKVVK